MKSYRFIAPDPAATADACARHAAGVIEAAYSTRGTASLAISGGSSPKLLFDELARIALPWDSVHIFWVDERCVPPTDDQSNYKLAQEHLIRPASIPEANLHRVYGELSPQDGAARYTADIMEFFGLADGAFPQFDLVHRGMGPDGHTASLFPNDPLTEDRKGIAAAVYSELFKQWRVTLLPGPLIAARHTVFLVTGADKQEALRASLQGPYEPRKHPAQIAADNPDAVSWFLDEAAAKLLD